MKITRLDGSKRPYTLLIDQRDLALYQSHRWQRHTKGLIRYPSKDHHRGSIFLHRAIMGVGPELYVVHRNGNKFDCRRKNLEVITYKEQRQRQKKPFLKTLYRQGKTVGVNFYKRTYTKPSGRTYTYTYADIGFTYRYKQRRARFCIETLGREEAIRRALAWRVDMICQHGLEPDADLLARLDEASVKAAAEAATRPPKLLKPPKAVKPPRPPKAAKQSKPPKPPKVPKLRLLRLPTPKLPKPKPVVRAKRRRPSPPRALATAPVSYTITDLPDGIVAIEHETLLTREKAELLLDATDLHIYQLRVWMINCDGILVSGLGRDQIRLHRLIAGVAPGERVTFRNGNTFDLRRDNLVIGGMCRNVMGLTAHGVYPSYKGRGANRVVRGVRAISILPGQGKAYREFSFEKYGESEANRRAYTFRIESLQAMGRPVPLDLVAKLESVTASSDHGHRPVSERSANFFRLMSVGGALSR